MKKYSILLIASICALMLCGCGEKDRVVQGSPAPSISYETAVVQ